MAYIKILTKPVSRNSEQSRGPVAFVVRIPRKQRPVVDLAAKAAAALELAEAIESAGRSDEALRAYRVIIADYPDTPSAAKAKEHVDSLTGRPKRGVDQPPVNPSR